MNELALFAGAGGGILGGHLLGWRCVCAVECEPYAAGVLLARQNDGILPPFPVWDDVRTFDGRPWRGIVDVVSGGFPCQDISAAGKGAGLDGERSGLWKEMARIIGEVGPRFVLVENSPVLTSRGLGVVLGDLAALGYDARWGVLGAIAAGAPHKRERIWIVAESRSAGAGDLNRTTGDEDGPASGEHVPALRQAHGADGSNRTGSTGASEDVADAAGVRERSRAGCGRDERGDQQLEGAAAWGDAVDGGEAADVADANGIDGDGSGHGASQLCRKQGREPSELSGSESVLPDAGQQISEGREDGVGRRESRPSGAGSEPRETGREGSDWWSAEPDVGRVAHGVAARVERLAALGNGQVPAVAVLAWRVLHGDGGKDEG